MSAYEFQDTAGNRYRLSKGAGPAFFHPENICSGSILRAELLLDGVDSQAVDGGFSHFYFDVLAQLPAKTSNPRKALADALAGNYLTLEQINTASAIDDYVPDERPFLKAQIQAALEKIIVEERREAAMHERQLSKESFGNVALIYLGGFAYHAYRSGKELVLWLKEVSDLVNPVVRMEHRFKAAQAAWLQDNLADAANVYAQTYVEGEKRELVEALGFDPTTITLEQLDDAMAMASLIWDDPNLKMQLTKFIKDYVSAQHSIEMTEALGAEALGILLSVILVALTAGAALPAVGFNAVRKFKVLGELLVEYARVTQRIARQQKRFSGKGKGPGKLESVEGSVKKTDVHGAEDGKPSGKKDHERDSRNDKRNRTNKPTPEEVNLAKSKGSTPEHIAARDKVARHYLENNGYSPDQTDLAIGSRNGLVTGGVDLTKPLEVVSFPPPDTMYQYVRAHGNPGNWFDPVGGQTADSLGLNQSTRHVRQFSVPEGDGLLSSAKPVVDDWTVPEAPVSTSGGGSQLFVNDSVKSNFIGL
jgi:hypothetical protein